MRTIDIADLRAVVFQRKNCNYDTRVQENHQMKTFEIPPNCSQCGIQWHLSAVRYQESDGEVQSYEMFLSLLPRIRREEAEGTVLFRIRFAFAEPTA